MVPPKSEAEIEAEAVNLINQEKALAARSADLAEQFPQFSEFLQEQKRFAEQSALFWEAIQNDMIANDIKSIKGDWGYITIAERTSFTVDEATLPAKFWKKVPDTKKIGDTFKLEGKAVKGTEPRYTKYLTKRIK